MYCKNCGAQLEEGQHFCAKCGSKQSNAQSFKVNSTGICQHCGKPFAPKGTFACSVLRAIKIIAIILFSFVAFITLIGVLTGTYGGIIVSTIFGIILLVPTCLYKKIRKSMELIPCPHCGMSMKGELVGKPSNEQATTIDNSTFANITTNEAFEGEYKTCARCRSQNAFSAKKCTSCGFKFGRIVEVKNGKQRHGLTTCPGCGEVYETKKNVPLIALLCIVGGLCCIWFPLGAQMFAHILLIISIFSIAILHAKGKLKFLSVKKCTVCKKTPLQIFLRKKSDQFQQARISKLLNRKTTPFNSLMANLNKTLEAKYKSKNVFSYIPIASLVIYIVSLLFSNKLSVYLDGDVISSRKLPYLDILANFYGVILIIVGIVILTSILTIIFCMLRGFLYKTISLITAIITVVLEILVILANTTMGSFEYTKYEYGEWIVYGGSFDAGLMSFIMALSAVILLASAILSYGIEKERAYLKTKKENI